LQINYTEEYIKKMTLLCLIIIVVMLVAVLDYEEEEEKEERDSPLAGERTRILIEFLHDEK